MDSMPAAESSSDNVVSENVVSEIVAASEPFVGRWGTLVSQTNWEKGRIIAEWREALVSTGAAPHEYADEAWSRLVGQVTPQHVGRLRRTYVRFHGQQASFDGLYWSHFLAALEWNDAELWLEGAVQNGWSISEMRGKRWETLGSPAGEEPREADVVAADLDEDAGPSVEGSAATGAADLADIRDPSEFGESGPLHEGPDFGDEEGSADGEIAAGVDVDVPFEGAAPQRPFEGLPDFPGDVREAIESFKLAILHHKMKEWSEVSPSDVVAALRALEQLVGAPS
ncbi:MAG: hypothetical protein J0M17_12725 [Planctomycetes bacterium]|nr:hypothetical protein [Planctomycetota bacterium]